MSSPSLFISPLLSHASHIGEGTGTKRSGGNSAGAVGRRDGTSGNGTGQRQPDQR